MRRRSSWCEHCARSRSGPPSCPPATTARWCWRQPVSRSCSTCGWTGTMLPRLELKGKPAPDAFLEAARRLGVDPARAVIVEDAIAGVEAGRAGQFGCVIGVDRSGQSQAMREAGADVVVTTLAQVRVTAEPPSAWSLVFEGFDQAAGGYSRSPVHPGERLFRDPRGRGLGRGGWHSLSGDLPRRRLQPAAHRYRRAGGRERGSRQFPQLARARVPDRRSGLVRCEDRHTVVVSPGTRSAARHAVANHTVRGSSKAGGACCRSNVWSRWPTCIWARWN